MYLSQRDLGTHGAVGIRGSPPNLLRDWGWEVLLAEVKQEQNQVCVGGVLQRDGVPVFVTGLCHLCTVLWQSSAGGPSPLPVLSVALYKWHFGSHLFKGGDNELGEMRKTLRPGCFSE